MGRPSYDELDQMYREALRKIVQERQRADAIERLYLAEAARHRQAAQAIDLGLEQLKRQEERQDTGRVMRVVARANHVDLEDFEADPHGERNG